LRINEFHSFENFKLVGTVLSESTHAHYAWPLCGCWQENRCWRHCLNVSLSTCEHLRWKSINHIRVEKLSILWNVWSLGFDIQRESGFHRLKFLGCKSATGLNILCTIFNPRCTKRIQYTRLIETINRAVSIKYSELM